MMAVRVTGICSRHLSKSSKPCDHPKHRLIVKNSNIGISSKDGSIATIHKANISDVNTCVSSYNKKQEFNGGIISFNKFNCRAFQKKFYVDKFSKIVGIN